MKKQELNVLLVTASARQSGSVTRKFANELLDELRSQFQSTTVQQRDVAAGMPFIDESWINANFTAEDQRSGEQKSILASSDALVDELQIADVILIAAPVYNFSIPASLKAWVDQIARVGLTFNYTSNGPVGRLQGKKAYIVFASGGTEMGSDIDFASTYLRHVLGFIGISDVSFISASRYNVEDEQTNVNIRAQIRKLAQQAA